MKAVALLLKALPLVALVALVATVATAIASDRMALYSRVDKVVLEPTAESPRAIQIWGIFSLARPDDPNEYLPPARGYLYFEAAGNVEAARKEWADLKQIAGSGQIVAFGSRYELKPRLRNESEKPERPDRYVVSVGLTKVRGNTDYAPVHGLLEFQR
jgi:hypothetical protein